MEHQGLVLVFKAPDVSSVWLALSLDFDLMSQGDSEEQAIEYLKEVVTLSADEDRKRNLDVWGRAPTSLESLRSYLETHKEDPSFSLQRVTFTF
jgi:hypothetical protein